MKLNNGEYSFYPAPGRPTLISYLDTRTHGRVLLLLAVSCFANFSLYCINIYCNSISQAIEMPFAPLIQCNTCQRRLGSAPDFSTANFFSTTLYLPSSLALAILPRDWLDLGGGGGDDGKLGI